MFFTPETSKLMQFSRRGMGKYELKIGCASLELGPGEVKKLQKLVNQAALDYTEQLAADAMNEPHPASLNDPFGRN
ncbi:hypothetical protein KS4_11640 [Poriferisphaera corsica]|uniref:Uncharacterized protein n=1 Tax=Poriferisphaera corsica TaxID=2528020 RepID=A0A517YSK4_9BACT|nr:hypothetical protein [Poriferisphaera corsica]QDU33122.1 hypothetical protein KS4_11640 [Poriferisphaera corsica]